MKYATSLFVLFSLFAFNAPAQKINKGNARQKPHICGVTIAGISSFVAGTGMGIGGIVLRYDAAQRDEGSGNLPIEERQARYYRDARTALVVGVSGIVLFVGGLGMTIGGAVHDHQRQNRWGLISPKMNEIGLAYNF